jgi:hypothetical protein
MRSGALSPETETNDDDRHSSCSAFACPETTTTPTTEADVRNGAASPETETAAEVRVRVRCMSGVSPASQLEGDWWGLMQREALLASGYLPKRRGFVPRAADLTFDNNRSNAYHVFVWLTVLLWALVFVWLKKVDSENVSKWLKYVASLGTCILTSLFLFVNNPAESKRFWVVPSAVILVASVSALTFLAIKDHGTSMLLDVCNVLLLIAAFSALASFSHLVLSRDNDFATRIQICRAHTAKLLRPAKMTRARFVRGRSKQVLYFELAETLTKFGTNLEQIHSAASAAFQIFGADFRPGTAVHLSSSSTDVPPSSTTETDVADDGTAGLKIDVTDGHVDKLRRNKIVAKAKKTQKSIRTKVDAVITGELRSEDAPSHTRGSKALDNVLYLPTVVWVAVGLSFCMCVALFCYSLIQARELSNQVAEAGLNARNAATLWDEIPSDVDLDGASTTLEETSVLLWQYASLLNATGQEEAAANAARLAQQATDISVALDGWIVALNGTNASEQGEYILTAVADLSDSVSRRLRPLLFTSSIVALLAAVYTIGRSVLRFRRVRIAVRKGQSSVGNTTNLQNNQNWTVSKANKFVGIQAGAIISGFVFVYCIVFIVLFVLSSEQLWLLLWDNISVIVVVAFGSLVQIVFLDLIVGNRWLSNGFWITRPFYWSWFNSFMTFASLITGLLYSVKRFAMLILVALRAAFLLDETIFPDFMKSLDTGHASFMSVIFLQHRHNHPILMHLSDFFQTRLVSFEHASCSACSSDRGSRTTLSASCEDTLHLFSNPIFDPTSLESLKSNPSHAINMKKVRARTRWKLAFTLINNPGLIADRHSSLQKASITPE